MIGRRAFFATLIGVATTQNNVTAKSAGFVLSGHFAHAGMDGEGWYSVGPHLAIMLDRGKLPACFDGAQALVGSEVELTLTRKV